MARVILENQTQFLQDIKATSGWSTIDLAHLCHVSDRTFRDWLRSKFTIPEDALLILSKEFEFELPSNLQIVDDYWYAIKGARKGALKRLELYGPPGTPAGRRKGGINSQLVRKENPEKYRLLGCKTPKQFTITGYSPELAEVIGIILGDGGITNHQLRISVSSIVDRKYALHVRDLFTKVFNEQPQLLERKSAQVIDIMLSGIDLVEALEKLGLYRGNKVKHQVDFPSWIWQNIDFQKACVRGLMDTDGGCFFHKHTVNGLMYQHFGMCFANHSLPIITSFAQVLKSLEIKAHIRNNKRHLFIYRLEDIQKYFKLISTSNPKNLDKLTFYLGQKSHRIYG